MDSFELNKIIGAVLGTLLFVMGAGLVAEAIYHPIEAHGPGYELPEPELVAQADAGAAEGGTPEVALGTLLASASAERGAAAAKKCQSCHDFSEANTNKTGPGLYDIVDRVIGGHEGFAYSDAMLAHKAAGETWTYDELNAFLTSPKEHTPGTKMNFRGVAKPEERADMLAYLGSLSASPKPFPAAEAAPAAAAADAGAAAGGAPAQGGAPASEAVAMLASASAEQGAASAKKCQSCHDFSEANTNKTGPGLYDIVDRVIGAHPDYAYSPAMLAKKEAGETWTFDQLDAFLLDPKAHTPGTKMSFRGVAKPEERANIMAYLATLSATPKALPGAGEQPAAEPAAAAPAEPAAGAEPAQAVDTPTTTQTETPVVGTPTTSGAPAATETPAQPAAPAAQ